MSLAFVLAQESAEVNAGAVNSAGALVGLVGVLLVAAWLAYLYR
ncbi:MAG: hypothetical protein ABEJ31_01615 [Haloarculaceae archaeon]